MFPESGTIFYHKKDALYHFSMVDVYKSRLYLNRNNRHAWNTWEQNYNVLKIGKTAEKVGILLSWDTGKITPLIYLSFESVWHVSSTSQNVSTQLRTRSCSIHYLCLLCKSHNSRIFSCDLRTLILRQSLMILYRNSSVPTLSPQHIFNTFLLVEWLAKSIKRIDFFLTLDNLNSPGTPGKAPWVCWLWEREINILK